MSKGEGWHGTGVDMNREFSRVAAIFSHCAQHYPVDVEEVMAEERLDPFDGATALQERLSAAVGKAWGHMPDAAALERAVWMASTVASAFSRALLAWDRRLEASPESGKAVQVPYDEAPLLRPLADTATALEGVGAVAAKLASLGDEFAAAISAGTATVRAKGRTTLTDQVKDRVKVELAAPRKTFTTERGLRLRQLPHGAYLLTFADFAGRVEAAALELRAESEKSKGLFGAIRSGQALRMASVILARRETGALVTGQGADGSWIHGAMADLASEGIGAEYLASLVAGAWQISSDARDLLEFLTRHAAEMRTGRLFERVYHLTDDAMRDYPGGPAWWGPPTTKLLSRLSAVAAACSKAIAALNVAKEGRFISNLPTPTRILAWGSVEILASLRPQEAEITGPLVETISGIVTSMVNDDVTTNLQVRHDDALAAAAVWQSGAVAAGGLANATDAWRIRLLEWRHGARMQVD